MDEKEFFAKQKQAQQMATSQLQVLLDQPVVFEDVTAKCKDPQCAKMTVRYVKKQSRCADEGQSTFYGCTTCGKTWFTQ
jgi:DNA-directed RNA polymerase subunit M/transcription elongation factor TFIIS